MDLEKIVGERAALLAEMRRIHDTASAEGRDLTSEEGQEYGRREARFDECSGIIERERKLSASVEAPADDVRGVALAEAEARSAAGGGSEVEVREGVESAEYRAAFESFLRNENLDAEKRAVLIAGTQNLGGYTVPQEWRKELIAKMTWYSPVRQYATVLTTSEGNQLNIPTVVDGQTATIVAENGADSDTNDTFGTVPLSAYKYQTTVKVSHELIQDSLFDLDGFVKARIARALAVGQGAHFATGTGTGQPKGVLVAAGIGKTCAAVAAITSDELIDLYFSLSGPYRSLGTFLLGDDTVKAIRKLKDTTNQYLWQPSLSVDKPDTLLGRPVITDPNIATLATGNLVGAFGDLSQYYIRDAGAPVVRVLVERFVDQGAIGYKLYQRTDANLVDTNAVKSLKMA